MNGKLLLQISDQEQAFLLKTLRKSRRDYLLGMHIALLSGRGYSPTGISRHLIYSRTTVYRTRAAYNQGELSWQTKDSGSQRRLSWVQGLLSLVKRTLRAYGWMRTREVFEEVIHMAQVTNGIAY